MDSTMDGKENGNNNSVSPQSNSNSNSATQVFDTNVGDRTKAAMSLPSMKVLDEDTYRNTMSEIIERDYFPKLPKLRRQLEWLEAEQHNDFKKMKELSKKEGKIGESETPQDFSPPPNELEKNEESNEESRTITLDEFAATYTSEDNSSFDKIMEKTNETRRKKYAWAYKKEEEEKERKLLLMSSNSSNAPTLLAWDYSAANHLMLEPPGMPFNETEEVARNKGSAKEIVRENTRIDEDIFKKPTTPPTKPKGGDLRNFRKDRKIDLDELRTPTALLLDSPHIEDYNFLTTPSPIPGVSDEPILTWGTIEGTPVSLDGTPKRGTRILADSSPSPSYRLPETSEREQIARKLVEKQKANRSKSTPNILLSKMKASPLRSPGPSQSPLLKSPKTVSSSPFTGIFDSQLRASYSPSLHKRPSSTPLASPKPSKTPKTSSPLLVSSSKEKT